MRASSPIAENPVVLALPVTHAFTPQRVNSLLSNVSWMLSANIVQVAVQLGMLLALTRCSDLATVGRFAYASAVVNPVILLAQMQLRNLQVVDISRRFSFRDYLSFRATSVCAAMLILVAISCMHSHDLAAIILALSVVRVTDSISDMFQGALQQAEQFRALGISTMLRNILSGIGFIGAIVCFQDLNAAVLTLASVSLAITIGLDIPLWFAVLPRSGAPGWPLSRSFLSPNFSKIAVTAFPLGCATFLSAVEGNLPRYFLAISASEEAIGIFSTIVACANLGAILINAIAQSVGPQLARLLKGGEIHAFRRFVGTLVLCGFGIGFVGFLGALFMGKQALTLVFGNYEPRYLSLLLVILAGVALCYTHIFIGTGLMAANLYSVKSRLQLISVCSCAVLLVLLTPSFQIFGAAISLLGTSAIMVFLHAAVFLKYIQSELAAKRCEIQPQPNLKMSA